MIERGKLRKTETFLDKRTLSWIEHHAPLHDMSVTAFIEFLVERGVSDYGSPGYLRALKRELDGETYTMDDLVADHREREIVERIGQVRKDAENWWKRP